MDNENIKKVFFSLKNRGWAVVSKTELKAVLGAYKRSDLIINPTETNTFVYIVEVKKK